jgi:tetratricopeptide (TPR) repeat protein
MKQNITFLSITTLLCFLFMGCHFGTSGSWVNDNIEANVRADIGKINKQLFKALMADDKEGVKKLLSPVLIEKEKKSIDTLVDAVSKNFNVADYDVVDEYYTKNAATNISNTLISTKGNSNDYIINYLALNREMYVSLLTPKTPNVSVLILAIYGKYDNGWKLNILQVNQYKILNKTAADYYNEALKNYDKGYLVDAANLMFIASKLLAPGAAYFKYKKDDEMKAFYQKAIQDANTKYNFPLILQQIKTKPQIFNIEPQLIINDEPKGFFPIIRYKSVINVVDTVALKAENKEVQKVIGDVFKGINRNSPVIIYEAYNQIPDGKTEVRRFGMIQKLK